MTPRLRGVGTALLVLTLAATGCVAGDGPSVAESPAASAVSDETENAEVGPKGLVGGPQPFDLLRPDDVRLVNAALRKLQERCLAKAGYPEFEQHPVPIGGDVVSGDFARFELVELGPRSEAEARTGGFNPASSLYGPEPFEGLVVHDEAFEGVSDACRREATAAFPAGAVAAADALDELASQFEKELNARLRSDPRSLRLAEERLACLEDAGYHSARSDHLPVVLAVPEMFGVPRGQHVVDVPGDEPTGSGVIEVLTPPQTHYEPHPEEVKFAIADLRCRRSLDYDRRIWEVAVSIEEAIVAEHEATLTELGLRLDEALRYATEILQG